MKRRFAVAVGAGLLVVACQQDDSRAPTAPTPAQTPSNYSHDFPAFEPSRVGRSAPLRSAADVGPSTIGYYGGVVIPTMKIQTIYWASRPIYAGGPTPGTSGPGSADGSLVGYFLNHLGGSPYYEINASYGDNFSHRVQNSLTYTRYWASNTNVPAPGATVSDAAVQA